MVSSGDAWWKKNYGSIKKRRRGIVEKAVTTFRLRVPDLHHTRSYHFLKNFLSTVFFLSFSFLPPIHYTILAWNWRRCRMLESSTSRIEFLRRLSTGNVHIKRREGNLMLNTESFTTSLQLFLLLWRLCTLNCMQSCNCYEKYKFSDFLTFQIAIFRTLISSAFSDQNEIWFDLRFMILFLLIPKLNETFTEYVSWLKLIKGYIDFPKGGLTQ